MNVGAVTFGGQTVRFGKPGMSDLLGILRGGYLLAIEVKSANGRVSPEQRDFLAMVSGFGGCAFVARSVEEASTQVAQFIASRAP